MFVLVDCTAKALCVGALCEKAFCHFALFKRELWLGNKTLACFAQTIANLC